MSKPTRFTLINLLVFGLIAGLLIAANNHDDRPFKGTTTGTSTVTGMPQPGIVTSTGQGNLNATHLGSGEYVIAASQDYPRHLEAEHPVGNCAFVDGTVQLIASNGDQINGDIDGDRSVTCAPDDQGPGGAQPGDVYYSTLYIDVTGGTGRFADATGWIFSEGTSTVQNDGTTVDAADLFGDIDY